MKKTKYLCSIFIVYLILLNIVVCRATEDDGKQYYLVYFNDLDNNITIELGTEKVITEQAYGNIDLSNLIVFPMDMAVHYAFQLDQDEMSEWEELTKKVRVILLENGYAKIDNEMLATEEELEVQEYAMENFKGGWAKEKESTEDPTKEFTKESEEKPIEQLKNTISIKLAQVSSFCKKNRKTIITYIVSSGFLLLLFKALYKRFRTRKKKIFLGGGNGSGKTTLKLLLLNPEASYDDLINQSTTLKQEVVRVIRDDENKKMILDAKVIDPPGHGLWYVIDNLSKQNNKRWNKSVVVIMLSPTKGYKKDNPIDQDYILEQYEILEKLWIPLLKAKSTIYPETIVLFINKKDLFDNKEDLKNLFRKHIDLMEKLSNEDSSIHVETISGSILTKAGMTDLMEIFKR